jgi:hypothetical protein
MEKTKSFLDPRIVMGRLLKFTIYSLILFISACGADPESVSESALPPEVTEESNKNQGEEPKDPLPTTEASIPGESNRNPAKDYTVKLAVDSVIAFKSKGKLMVWIGKDVANFNAPSGMVEDEKEIPADAGQFAKITPITPGFKKYPNAVECIKIHPSGSEVIFELEAIEKGEFEVSARVDLYNEAGCKGDPTPKVTTFLKVNVFVDREKEFSEKVNELLTVAWDKFLSFWGALLTLIFGTIIYLIRKKIKKKTGYDDKPENEN